MSSRDRKIEVTELWTTEEAIRLCKMIEPICPKYGCHVALTGGLLYKEGPRKDADLVFYRIRQVDKIDVEGLFKAIPELERSTSSENWAERWCIKATYQGRGVDCFFPENTFGEYL